MTTLRAEQPRRILITGSRGFTGRPLAAALAAKGHHIIGLTSLLPGPGELTANLLDRDAVKRAVIDAEADVVVHLAGITFPAHPSATEIYSTNVLGGLHLLEALEAARKAPDLVIVAGSATIYAPGPTNLPLSEDAELRPINHYGVSKKTLEDVCLLFKDKIPIQVTRPFGYVGVGQSSEFFVSKIVKHFSLNSREIELGNVNLYRDISSLSDVVEAYVRMVDLSEAGAPVNICSGEAVHLGGIIETMRQISGRSMSVRVNPNFVRLNEPKFMIGSRVRLDERIGVWKRLSLPHTLEVMYKAGTRRAPIVIVDGWRRNIGKVGSDLLYFPCEKNRKF